MTTDHDQHDFQANPDHGDSGHDAHGTDDHGVPTASSPTGSSEPLTPLSAFIWPGLISLLVLALLWGPVTSAFGREQREPEPLHSTAGEHGGTTAEPGRG